MASKSPPADDAPGTIAVDAVAVPITVHAVAVPITADSVALPIKTADDYSAEELATVVTYRDNLFTSRSLVMPGGRLLQVSKGRVSVKVIDAQARAYLDGHPDLEPLPE
ncbi:hypothetical protein [Pseudomonas taetrolens]|uniref:hypothetical protein n=1 Tax=Pseudomonas taetrolens TaxID=47884 RepID=UPI0030DA38C6